MADEIAAKGAEEDAVAKDHDVEVIDTTYQMSVELSVLESLGINLYSNAAAVLSELVANAYDADADAVTITWVPDKVKGGGEQLTKVVVVDDGAGMEVEDLNNRFLKAGYKKRDEEGFISPKYKRPFMGRKGIGKLSVFSLAEVVEVYSKTESGEAHGFTIEVEALERAIKNNKKYFPQPIVPIPVEHDRKGTSLVLSKLKSKRAGLTASALRKRLARRFDVLDERKPGEGGFRIVVNNNPITYADRQELKRLQFIWEFGEDILPKKVLPTGIERFKLPTDTVDAVRGWKVKGWFGTASKPTDLVSDEEAGSLKNIIVLARKRPIQEGIIEKLDFSRLFGNYVTGQIEADFLDVDDPDYDDIATSDRQRLIEDDERVMALQKFLRSAFLVAAEQWSEARPKREAKDALKRYPKLNEWIDGLKEYQQEPARKMIGTIASIELEDGDSAADRTSLLRSGILAFERVGLRDSAKQLDLLGKVTAEDLLPLLGQQDAYESGLWVDILRSRVEAIERLKDITSVDDRERVLQEHLFKHLWLLDPSWERATGSEHMEQDLRTFDPDLFATDENGKQIFGRVDIRYATQSGRHVIVELKRYGVKADVADLAEQGAKYVRALADILTKQGRADEVGRIEVIFVLGEAPTTKGNVLAKMTPELYTVRTFENFGGSYRTYDTLITQARSQYQEYLDASSAARELDELLEGLSPESIAEADEEDQAEMPEGESDSVEPATDGPSDAEVVASTPAPSAGRPRPTAPPPGSPGFYRS